MCRHKEKSPLLSYQVKAQDHLKTALQIFLFKSSNESNFSLILLATITLSSLHNIPTNENREIKDIQ